MIEKVEQYKGWKSLSRLGDRQYNCANCGTKVTSDLGYYNERGSRYVYVCPCGEPTIFNRNSQYPSPSYGENVKGIEGTELSKLYDEARNCFSANAFTAVALCCRKLLMHIAVEKGAHEGLKFVEYVDYLYDKHLIPVDGKKWIDYIRQKGNEATHEIIVGTEEEARLLIEFSGMLLKINYEYPSVIASKVTGA